MVKADAYNHGASAVAKYVEDLVDAYAVAQVEEGAFLRAQGVTSPIIVMGYDGSSKEIIRDYTLIPVIHDINSISSLKGCTTCCDLKIDSGMNRLGFNSPTEIACAIKLLEEYDVKMRAVCTHFYSKESILEQLDKFNSLTAPIKGVKVHCSATTGILSGYIFDEVRVGMLAYGYGSRIVKPAMRVTSNILAVRRLNIGDVAGYDGIIKCDKPMTIAIVSGGYYDGIDNALGKFVKVKDKYCKVLPSICMDMFYIDVTNVNVKVGDEVEIFSKELVDKENIIRPYRQMTTIKGRAKRVYYN